MTYYNHFSHYQSENILDSPRRPAHSGPEICNDVPRSRQADTLAREVVLDRVMLISEELPIMAAGSGSPKGLRFSLK
ncbi:MAG: hypothetical protein ABI778_10040 [Ignavibacteriota bacterium]